MDVVRIVDPEGRLHDGQLNYKLNASRTAEAEIRSGRNRQSGAQFCSWKNTSEALRTWRAGRIQRGWIKSQSAAFRDAARATVKKEGGLEVLLHDRNAVLDVSKRLRVATRKRCSMNERWNRERTRAGRYRHRGSSRDKSHRRNGPDIVPANIVLTAHIKTAIGR